MMSNKILKYHARLWIAVVTILGALQIGGCNTTPTQSPSVPPPPVVTPSISSSDPGETLRLVYFQAPTMLNPYLANANKDVEVSRIFYEPLATVDSDGDIIPILSAEVPSVENGDVAHDLTWVIWKLKRGVRWSDGQQFTAEDVKFTYEYATNPAVGSPYASFYSAVASVDVIDTYTVRVNFKAPTASWSIPFTNKAGMILPRHVFSSYNGANARSAPANVQPVGTGPYRIVGTIKPQEVLFLGSELVQTNKIICEPNPYFRAPDKQSFRRIEIHGGGAVEQAFRTVLEDGTADYAYLVELSDQQQHDMEARGYGKLVDTLGGRVLMLALNFTDPAQGSIQKFSNPILSDKLVREAIAHAIDRDRIVREVYGSAAVAENNYIFMPQPNSSPAFYTFDLKAAAALLDQAGWVDSNNDGVRDKGGQQLQLIYQTAINPQLRGVLQIVKQDLESIGFRIIPDIKDPKVYYGDASNPNSYVRFQGDLASFTWFFDSHDPLSKLAYWTCSAIPTPENGWSGYNAMRWCNADFDHLFAQAQSELDDSKRQQLIRQMNDILIQDVAMVVIAQPAQRSAVSVKLKGFAPTPWDAETWNIQDWKKVTTP